MNPELLMTVADFRSRVAGNLEGLIHQLQLTTGRSGEEEAAAWRASLPALSATLDAVELSPFHLYLSGAGYLALEYQLPAASSWCDVILLGRRQAVSSAVVIELKNWTTWGDQPGPYEGLMFRQGNVVLHPSEQVRGYAEYCQRFHSAVQERGARVAGCVLFTKDHYPGSYLERPNDRLVQHYPCLTSAGPQAHEPLQAYVSQHLTDSDEGFAEAFVEGRYRQSRGFVRQIGKLILDPGKSPFELLDNQRRAFAMVRARVESALFSGDELTKQVILIEGPPGSGKSVLAAKLWATLVGDERLPEGSVVLTTTSVSQTSNWSHLFKRASGSQAAAGVVKRAASYMPVSTQSVGRFRKLHGSGFLAGAEGWREHIELLRNLGVSFQEGARDDQYLISIVDEAHALINPELPEGRGQFGFAPTLGPQAWHIIRASKVSIFLMDSEQGFRDRENTSAIDLEQWAKELGAQVGDRISLAGAQFRCAGSKEYVDWVEALLSGASIETCRNLAGAWQRVLDFQICDTPAELELALRTQVAAGRTARLVASYARRWRTKGAARPHALPPDMQDFQIAYLENGDKRVWSRVWNFIPRSGSDYTWFIQAPEGSPMHDDPMCEVGCPYAVRGFDFDYVGLLWLSDLKHRDGHWVADSDHVHETGLSRTLSEMRREGDHSLAASRLKQALMQAYRILLTRGIYGVYLWFEDAETRRFVEACLDAEVTRRSGED